MSTAEAKWDLQHWLSVLENRHKVEIHLGLDKITEVAKRMDVLEPTCTVITVGGTNGKGSTVSALERIYHTAGYKVGTYTSPHLISYNERIRLNLKLIPDEDLCTAFSIIEDARGATMLSYFETSTLAALWYFKQQQVDVMLLEVGLGGRLDATNCINSNLSIITTIDFDHQEFLGTTLEAIGFEKAGIMRTKMPCIYADTNPPASIMEQAKIKDVPLYCLQDYYSFIEQNNHWDYQGNSCMQQIPKPKIQLKSAAAALTAIDLLQDALPVSESAIKTAMQYIFVPGRLEFHPGSVSYLFDVSHNPQSVRLLAGYLRQNHSKSRIHAVFSALKDKDIFGLIMPLKDCVDHWYPAQLDYKRAASVDDLISCFKEAEIETNICYTSPLVAFKTALEKAEDGDLIVVYGSFFTVSYVKSAWQHQLEQKEIQ